MKAVSYNSSNGIDKNMSKVKGQKVERERAERREVSFKRS